MPFPPSVSDFQAFFVREFDYSDGPDKIVDGDITRAITEAGIQFNTGLFDTTTIVGNSLTEGAIAYLYLSAHIMVLNIQGAGGLSALQRNRGARDVGEGVIVNKGIGSVSVSYQVPPPVISDSPILLYLFRTNFGQRYLEILMPRLIGNVALVSGRSFWEQTSIFTIP